MSTVSAQLMARFVSLAAERLEGAWVIMGGAVLPLVGVEHRVTLDIDVAGPDTADMAQTLALMEIAVEIGLCRVKPCSDAFAWRDRGDPLHDSHGPVRTQRVPSLYG